MTREDIWISDIRTLTKKDKLYDFWPDKHQEPFAKVNAITRLMIYFTIIVSLYRKNITPILLLLISMTIIAILYKKQKKYKLDSIITNIKDDQMCSKPTKNNPFVNRLIGESVYKDTPCEYNANDVNSKFIQNLPLNQWDIYNKNNSQRQFYTVPNNELPNNQGGFAEWLYGKETNCKTDSSVCNGLQGLTN